MLLLESRDAPPVALRKSAQMKGRKKVPEETGESSSPMKRGLSLGGVDAGAGPSGAKKSKASKGSRSAKSGTAIRKSTRSTTRGRGNDDSSPWEG